MKKRIFSGFLSAVLVLSLLPWSAMAADEQEPLMEQPQAKERQEQDPGVPVTLPADPETALPVAITLDPQEDEQEQETQPEDQPDQEPEQTPEQEPKQDLAVDVDELNTQDLAEVLPVLSSDVVRECTVVSTTSEDPGTCTNLEGWLWNPES